MYKWLPLLIFLLLKPLKAEEILTPGSQSPNHKYEVYAVDHPESGQPDLQLREAATNKTVISLGGSGWCDSARGLSIPGNASVMWNDKGDYVAVKTRDTKTSFGVTLYRNSHGTFSTVPLPSFWDAIKSYMGLQQSGRCYFESIKEWKGNNIFVMNVSGSTIDSSGISESDPEWYSYDITVNTSGKIVRIEEIKKGRLPNKGTE